jgi:glycosyltransferase involved in cell wall biosynthesis
MGESARSMRALLESTGLAVRPLTLPNEATLEGEMPPTVELFGWPWADAALSIAVANADVTARLAEFLPHGFRAKRNIGYWVWETETLPARFRHAQSAFDEIWTPSRYSAQAISATIDRPVRVLPHCVDLASIDRAHPDRARFGLPSDALLFGFAFDPRSNLERKNVLGLLRAFQSAFRHDDHCYLVLKVNSARFSSYEFDRIKGEVINDRVLFVEGVLDRISTFAFMKSLDTYVSLHRSEGFGLSCAEAMACGLPVVASRYSGNLDFMRDDNSLLVTTRVVQTDRPHGPYPAGTRWGDPDLDAAVAALRDLLADHARRHLGDAGNSSVRRELSRDRIGERLMALISSDQEPSPMAVPSDPTARWPS